MIRQVRIFSIAAFGVLFALLCTGCAGGFILTTHTESFPSKRKDFKKIICINPEYRFFNDNSLEDEDFDQSQKLKQLLRTSIEQFSKKNGFEYEVHAASNTSGDPNSYFNKLLLLRKNIIQSIRVQDNPLNQVEHGYDTHSKGVFIVNTLIPFELSELSGEFGTPYFAIFDVYSSKTKTFVIHIVANLNLGRIEYQEVKRFNNNANATRLPALVYDSFYFLKKSFSKA